MNDTSQNSKPISTGQSKAARTELERALSLHFQGDRAGALKALRKALTIDPALASEKLAINLAHEITGLPAAEALNSLGDQNLSKEMIGSAQKEERTRPRPPGQRISLFALVLFSLVLIGMCGWSIANGTLGAYLTTLQVAQLQSQKASLAGYDYYVAVPNGSVPEDGWPMVVAFHGYGGDGRQMLPLAKTFTDAGALFVAPTLGEYRPNPGDGPLEPVHQILTQISKEYPLQSRGAILLGHSQGGSFAYRFSVYHAEWVSAVVTAGAPEFDSIFPTRNIPYIFTWGAQDGLQDFVLPMVYPIQNRGYNVQTYIVPGVGHELSQYAIDQAVMLLQQP